MIRDLISSNSFFREKIEFYKQFIESHEKEMFSLMRENQALREHADLPLPHPHPLPQLHHSQQAEPASFGELQRANPSKAQRLRLKTHANETTAGY
jgi:hypothetical protein